MNICYQSASGRNECKIQEGHLILDKPYTSFKVGDYVSGKVFITQPDSLTFNFKYTIVEPKYKLFCG